MTEENYTCPDKHDYIWASGFYLSEELPQTFDTWDNGRLVKYIGKYASIENKHRKPSRIWEDIDICATAFKKYFLEKITDPEKFSKAPKKYFVNIGDEYPHIEYVDNEWQITEYRYKSNGETVEEVTE
tara:strand:- start:206 stop:589 length:384 start_codon:yes stop_codon:yes gene_type:complete